MICPDCATGADLAATTTSGNSPAVADLVTQFSRAGHDRCRERNTGREHGQLADCTCQHTTPAATATYARS